MVGISDNLPGIALAYLSVAAVILALVHRWTERRRFATLALTSVVGFAVLAGVHNAADAVAQSTALPALLVTPLEIVSGAAFVGATMVCPAALLIAIAGYLRLRTRSRAPSPE